VASCSPRVCSKGSETSLPRCGTLWPVLRQLRWGLNSVVRSSARRLGSVSGHLLLIYRDPTVVALLGVAAGARWPWSRPADEVVFGEVQVSVLDEDCCEMLAVNRLIGVDGWTAAVSEPVVAESVGERGGDAVLLRAVEGSVAIGGQSSPARVCGRGGTA
jgi:hypothetical protein